MVGKKIENISSFKLLYRASEHNFSSAQFHQKCDDKPNTLVIVQTEFDKIVGGFTAKSWNQSGSYVQNE